MKIRFAWLGCVGALAGGLVLVQAQRPCLPFFITPLLPECAWQPRHEPPCTPYVFTPAPEYAKYDSCTVTMEFVQPIDLDDDGTADFTHERFRSYHHYNRPANPDDPDDRGKLYIQDDRVEAYFPAEHVELYWLIWGPGLGGAEARLAAGQEVEVNPVRPLPGPDGRVPLSYGSWGLPEPERSRVYPDLETQGLGLGSRWIKRAPCPGKPPPFEDECYETYLTGYLYRDVVWEGEEYFGFRLWREDGWHLGWLRLRFRYEHGKLPPVELVDWAVHPEPDTAIVVGEPARPTLRYGRGADGSLEVRWSPVWAGAVLERAARVTAPVWEPVAGATNGVGQLPPHQTQGFFRLRVP